MNDGQIRVVQLACVSCSATLDISQGMERLACGFCGTSQTVERSGGTVSLKGVAAVLQQVQQGTDKTAAELAIARLQKEIEDAENELSGREKRLKGAKDDFLNKQERKLREEAASQVEKPELVAASTGSWHGAAGGFVFLAGLLGCGYYLLRAMFFDPNFGASFVSFLKSLGVISVAIIVTTIMVAIERSQAEKRAIAQSELEAPYWKEVDLVYKRLHAAGKADIEKRWHEIQSDRDPEIARLRELIVSLNEQLIKAKEVVKL